jgi:hypothetical protein
MKNFSLTFFDKNLSILMILAMLYSIPSQTQVLHAQADTKSPDQKTGEEAPMVKQDGNVVLDPVSVSNSLKNSNLRHLKKLKSSFYNLGEKEKYDGMMKSYVDATITLSERKYTDARRKFEQNQTDINDKAKALTDKYKEKYSKLYADISYTVVDMKINTKAESANSSYEKYLAAANELQTTGVEQTEKGNYADAVYAYKAAILNLVRIPYFINKNKNKNLKIAEKIAKNLLIEDDYIPKENMKDFDDSREMIFDERELEREKERAAIKKGITSKLGGEVTPEPSPEPKKDPQAGTEKKDQ